MIGLSCLQGTNTRLGCIGKAKQKAKALLLGAVYRFKLLKTKDTA